MHQFNTSNWDATPLAKTRLLSLPTNPPPDVEEFYKQQCRVILSNVGDGIHLSMLQFNQQFLKVHDGFFNFDISVKDDDRMGEDD